MRTVLVAGIVVTAVGLVVSTGAVLPDTAVDTVDEELTLEPTSPYASLVTDSTGDRELVVQIGPENPQLEYGLNPDANTRIDDVFTIHNNAEQPATVWFATQPAGVTVTHDGQALTRTQSQEIAPGGDMSVGVMVNTTNTTGSTAETLQLRAVTQSDSTASTDDTPPTVQVTTLAPNRREIHIDGTPTGTVTVPVEEMAVVDDRITLTKLQVAVGNPGTVTLQGTAQPTAQLSTQTVAEQPPAPENMTLAGTLTATPTGQTDIERATFVVAIETAVVGDRQVQLYHRVDGQWRPIETTIVDRGPETTTVRATTPGLSRFAVGIETPPLTATTSTTTAVAGTPVNFTITITNPAAISVDTQLTAQTATTSHVLETVTVGPTTTATDTINTTFKTPGTYTLHAGRTPVGTITVVEPQHAHSGPSVTNEGPTPTIEAASINRWELGGVIVSVVVALGGLQVLRHRHW